MEGLCAHGEDRNEDQNKPSLALKRSSERRKNKIKKSRGVLYRELMFTVRNPKNTTGCAERGFGIGWLDRVGVGRDVRRTHRGSPESDVQGVHQDGFDIDSFLRKSASTPGWKGH